MVTFNLEKAKAQVNFVLKKRQLPEMRAQVGITLDLSGSTEELYRSGVMQRTVEQIMPVGLRFDDNGELDVRGFNDGNSIADMNPATATNYEGYVVREILDNDDVPKWGGTDYAPVIERMLEQYGFRTSAPGRQAVKKSLWSRLTSGGETLLGTPTLQAEATSGEAVVNYFLTDGQNGDQAVTYRLLKECQDARVNMYFLFIGVGDARRFGFLERIAADFGNVGFLSVADLAQFVNSDDIYEKLLPEELTQWLVQKHS